MKDELDLDELDIAKEDAKHISEHELFETEHYDYVWLSSILEPIKLMTFTEFENEPQINDLVYFQRCTYHPGLKKLDPPFNQWTSYCNCGKPSNPELVCCQCDKCKGWFHPECQGYSEEEAQEDGVEFFCTDCVPKPN